MVIIFLMMKLLIILVTKKYGKILIEKTYKSLRCNHEVDVDDRVSVVALIVVVFGCCLLLLLLLLLFCQSSSHTVNDSGGLK